MKNLYLLTLLFLISLVNCTSLKKHNKDIASIQRENEFANNSLENDPRKYVIVSEIRDNYGELKKKNLWNWSSSNSSQITRLIDINSEIIIEFNKDSLFKNTNIKGDLSLVAEISSPKGFRKIEVLPYTEVGKEEARVGLPYRPSKEIAALFLKLIYEVYCVDKYSLECGDQSLNTSFFRSLDYYSNNEVDDNPYGLFNDYEALLKHIESMSSETSDTLLFQEGVILARKEISDILNKLNNFNEEGVYFSYGYTIDIPTRFSALVDSTIDINRNNLPLFKTALEDLIDQHESQKENAKNEHSEVTSRRYKQRKSSFILNLTSLLNRLKYIEGLFSWFDNLNPEAKSAFLSLIQSEINQFHESHIKLLDIISNFDNQINSLRQDSALIDEEKIFQMQTSLKNSLNELRNAYVLKGTFINDEAYNIYEERFAKKDSLIPPFIAVYNDHDRSDLIVKIAEQANRLIFDNSLKFASIDLYKSGAKENEILYISLKHIQKEIINEEVKESIKILPLGRYELRPTGWRTSIDDSFILVQRVKQPSASTDSTISPSNFKGAPGVSFMVTYNDNGYDSNWLRSFFNDIEPSFGVNVSYIDFSIEKDLEIGAGLILGLFNKTIFLNGGVNLNGLSVDDNHPFYVGLGFSFLSLADKFSN